MAVKFQVDPGREFEQALKTAIGQVNDLRIPLTLIAKSWFSSNKAIFALKGPGQYADLSENYKKQKRQLVGFIYPILKAEGRLEDSLVKRSGKDAISTVLNQKTLVLGTRVPYAGFHQFGTRKMPKRPPILIGAEQTRGAPGEINRREALWIKTIQDFVLQLSSQVGAVKP